MSLKRALELAPAAAEQGQGSLDSAKSALDFSGPWFNSRTAQHYIPCASLRAWYMWRKRHGIIPRSNGSVAKADLDRVLNTKKRRRVMNPRSLSNLRPRHTADSTAGNSSTVNPEIGVSE